MSSMRLGLIALGALFVLAVWIFNKYQEQRVRRRVEAPFAQPRRDVLLERDSPVSGFGGEHLGASTELGGGEELSDRYAETYAPRSVLPSRSPHPAAPAPQRTEPRFIEPQEEPFEDTQPHLASEPPEAEPAELPFELDEAIHALIPLVLEQPVTGDRALATLQNFRHAGRQTVRLLGWRDGAWYPLRVMERFEQLLVAIQLANRSGPLNEVEFSEFVTRLEHAAEHIPARCDIPDMIETIARARNLDAACAPLDAQIGLTLANPQGAWSGDLLGQEAEALGLILRSDGRFHAVLDDGTTLFSVQNADGPAFRLDNLEKLATSRVTFLLDLPRAPEDLEPYFCMTRAAQSMAEHLSAIIVDDQLRTLTPAMLETIARQIEPVYAKLEKAGLSAGSTRALALFS